MERITLTDAEAASIKSLLAEAESLYASVDETEFLVDAPVIAHELPRRVREFLNDFKQNEPPAGACIVSTGLIKEAELGPTPEHWNCRPEVSPTLKEEILFCLFNSLLGEVIGWATQQNGYIVHDVVPIESDENEQISTGSGQNIWWHNEDAFHPYRGDYISLMCLRNPDNVPTTLSPVSQARLSASEIESLFKPQFIIRPDESHGEENGEDCPSDDDTAEKPAVSYDQINKMQLHPEMLSILYGDPKSPYIRIDPFFMEPPKNAKTLSALNMLIRAMDASLDEVVLHPGDFLFVDNYRAVHGRKAFKARYDGTDRWLKRINVTRDLRKSRDSRESCQSRIIT
ncbi:MAG TPA: guanitoxin biosynthesis L-enduracididine beta-hydroxylase GntD [Pyrinomonadaceae bacterium]|jgi:Fe(II)/alpha-ketoglutarate-dependent arginine beta-hydroxylase|nr:guanitoxin biosynthesis L-enduracididine beta-hydroxylase GntD [Pyrinomonadaceae bacterium]